jgi:glutamine phosphoribosylpyrophosphate amidotransferase
MSATPPPFLFGHRRHSQADSLAYLSADGLRLAVHRAKLATNASRQLQHQLQHGITPTPDDAELLTPKDDTLLLKRHCTACFTGEYPCQLDF